MKNRLIYKYFDREVFNLNCGYKEAINRLCQMNGTGRINHSMGHPLEFYCNRRGKFYVDMGYGNGRKNSSVYMVQGRVFLENNQTKVEIYSTRYKRGYFALAIGLSAVEFVFMIFMFMRANFSNLKVALVGLVLIAANFLLPLFRLGIEETGQDYDLVNMRQEAVNRIDAVNKWDKE